MTIAFLCPGQGAQTPGFLHRLPPHPRVTETMREASDILGLDVLDLDTAEALQSTVAVQLSIVVAGVAVARALTAEGLDPEFVAGLSVGSFSAAVVADAIDLADALVLVRRRARLMEAAYPTGYGLAVIVGLPESRLRAIAADVARADDPVYLANMNAPTEIVVSGSHAALDRAIAAARSAGARRAERLAVPVPSHCPLLAEAAETLVAEAAQIAVRPPAITYIGNRRVRVIRDAAGVREELATNLAHPVRWHDTMTLVHELGAEKFLEMPPGNVLTLLAQEILPDTRSWSLDMMPFHSALVTVRR